MSSRDKPQLLLVDVARPRGKRRGKPSRMASCHPGRPHYGHDLCAPCYRAANHERRSLDGRMRRLRAFKLTEADYQRLYRKQRGRCAVCGRPERRTLRGKITALVVDHDHASDQVRGLLCHGCNVAIGHFLDSPEMLLRALRYLRAHAQLAMAARA